VTDDMRRDVEMFNEWDEIVNSYLSVLSGLEIKLSPVRDEGTMLRIRAFDEALRAFKAKYPEKFL